MALEPVDAGTVGTATGNYHLVATRSDYEVKGASNLVPIVEITAQSVKYGVEFTFNITQQTFMGEGAVVAAEDKTDQVDAICETDHVVGVRSEQDQGTDGNLYNYLVVTVGTPDGLITTDVKIRMDQIGTQSAFATIAAAWTHLQTLGA